MLAFADADYASKAADRRSVSGGVIMCGGAAVSWFSRTQKCVTLSTTAAENVALSDVLEEVLFSRQVWRFMVPQAGMPCIPVFGGQSECTAACAQPDHQFELETHRCWTPLYSGTRRKETNIGYIYTIQILACGFLDEGVEYRIIRGSPYFCDEICKNICFAFLFHENNEFYDMKGIIPAGGLLEHYFVLLCCHMLRVFSKNIYFSTTFFSVCVHAFLRVFGVFQGLNKCSAFYLASI